MDPPRIQKTQAEAPKRPKRVAPNPDSIKWTNVCYGYIRVSTKQQKDEGLSLENQKKKITAWGIVNDHIVKHVYADEGISGTTIDGRRQLLVLLDTIKQGETLVTLTFSRLSRSARDFLNIMYEMKMRGCRVVIVNEGLDTNSAYGRFTATMFSAVAELEADIISARVKDAMDLKKEKAEFVGRIPYGWKLSGEPGTGSELVEIEEEQAVIKKIKDLRASFTLEGRQYSYDLISSKLIEAGVKPPRKSKAWSGKQVSRIYNRKTTRTKGRSPNRRRGEAPKKVGDISSDEDEDAEGEVERLLPSMEEMLKKH